MISFLSLCILQNVSSLFGSTSRMHCDERAVNGRRSFVYFVVSSVLNVVVRTVYVPSLSKTIMPSTLGCSEIRLTVCSISSAIFETARAGYVNAIF